MAHPEEAGKALLSLVDRWGIDVVLPATDVWSHIVLRRFGGHVGRAVVAAPELAAFEELSNKAKLLERARQAGLAVPKSVVARDASEVREAVAQVGIPCILKPHTSIVVVNRVAHGHGVRRIGSIQDLDPPFPESAFPVVAQEFVPGRGEGVFLLVDRDRLVAAFAHRRLREKPPEGGVSVYRESIPLDPGLVAACARLLASVGWRGAAMIEFRRRPTGEAVVMEVNGRLWGSLQLAVDSGVDFASLLVGLFLGAPLRPVEGYQVGVRTRWLWGDVDHLLIRLRRLGRRGPAADPLPTLPRAFWDFFVGFGRLGDGLEVLDRRDLRPFLRETLDWLRGRSA